jgi:ABC-2 type transport system permease protein
LTALAAESLKFRTVPTGPRLVLAGAVLAWLTAALFLAGLPVTTGRSLAETPAADLVSAAVLGVDVAAIALIVLGALTGGTDLATGLAQPTYTLVPRRGRVVRAKAAVVVGAALAAGLLAAVGCVAIGVLAPVVVGQPAAPLTGVRLALGAVAAPVLYGVLALAGALVLRSTGGGVLLGLGFLALPTVLDWVPGLAALKVVLPAAAVHGLAGVSTPGDAEYLAAAPAALSLVGWVLLAVAVATWTTGRRDV